MKNNIDGILNLDLKVLKLKNRKSFIIIKYIKALRALIKIYR